MQDESLANWLSDNGLGKNWKSGKKRPFLSAREGLVDFFQNMRLKFFERVLKSIEEIRDFDIETCFFSTERQRDVFFDRMTWVLFRQRDI